MSFFVYNGDSSYIGKDFFCYSEFESAIYNGNLILQFEVFIAFYENLKFKLEKKLLNMQNKK